MVVVEVSVVVSWSLPLPQCPLADLPAYLESGSAFSELHATILANLLALICFPHPHPVLLHLLDNTPILSSGTTAWYRLCEKDRTVVKRLEKTRTEDHPDLQLQKMEFEKRVVVYVRVLLLCVWVCVYACVPSLSFPLVPLKGLNLNIVMAPRKPKSMSEFGDPTINLTSSVRCARPLILPNAMPCPTLPCHAGI